MARRLVTRGMLYSDFWQNCQAYKGTRAFHGSGWPPLTVASTSFRGDFPIESSTEPRKFFEKSGRTYIFRTHFLTTGKYGFPTGKYGFPTGKYGFPKKQVLDQKAGFRKDNLVLGLHNLVFIGVKPGFVIIKPGFLGQNLLFKSQKM